MICRIPRNLAVEKLGLKFEEVSTSCNTRNLPEINYKLIKQRQFRTLDLCTHALFTAVEHGCVEKTKTILETSEVDINCLNNDGLSPLDIAILSKNRTLAQLLIAYGAQEGRKFFSCDDMRSQLQNLLHEAEHRVEELRTTLKLNAEVDQSTPSSPSSNTSAAPNIENLQNKNYLKWERRAKGLKRMLVGFELLRAPEPPEYVTVEVTSSTSVMVHFSDNDNQESPITTKFRIQWSLEKDFCSLCGHFEVTDTRQRRYRINNLRQGQSYHIRVASGNIKGYSVYKLSCPSSVVLSSWQNIEGKETRFSADMKTKLDEIFTNVMFNHPYMKSNGDLPGHGSEIFINQRRRKTTIKQLFTAASKFQKHLKRGVYLSCLLYHEDKVLVTNEDFLPVIEIDENYPKKMHNDFHWFLKVAFGWNDLKWLKNDMEKSQNNSAIFRIKLLQAAVHMQTALSINELGKLYHEILRDTEGTAVISVINYIHSPKSVSVLNLRWLPLAKLIKRPNLTMAAESNVADILMSSIPDQITYHQLSNIRSARGLYLSYLKMRSSVDSLQVLVPCRAPNIPPHFKIRDNPHVTAEEWEWLVKKEDLSEKLHDAPSPQRHFIEQIAVAARRLFTYMEISEEEAKNHRLYDTEVIEINKDISLIMVIPPVEATCSMPGQRELLLQRSDLLTLTIQVFEMVHFSSYQLDLISTYSRLSCIIEMDIDIAQHSLRKAFSSLEVESAKSKLNELENLNSQLNSTWKKGRWLLEVISYARDRLSPCSTNMRNLLDVNIQQKKTFLTNESFCSPDTKAAKSRGSWPGMGRHLGRMSNQISRSEQHLTSECMVSINDEKTAAERLQSTKSEESSVTFSKALIPAASSEMISTDNLPMILIGTDNNSELERISTSLAEPRALQVYAAYNTDLEDPVHFEFDINSKTKAREIVELFVKQTNMTVLLKGKKGPIYTDEEIKNFCLVAVIGARERCLRDDFKPVQLQNPWKEGRMYVRRKSNVLAAIEYDSKQASKIQ